MLVSVTRLRLRSRWFLPGFFVHATRSRKQAETAAGFRDGKLISEGLRVFWTITRWDSENDLRAWRGRAAHGARDAEAGGLVR